MGLFDDLTPIKRVYSCRIRTLLATLEAGDRDKLAALLASPDWSHTQLVNALQSRGVVVTRDAIQRHREGVCSCLRT
jgi:hypothetical protein